MPKDEKITVSQQSSDPKLEEWKKGWQHCCSRRPMASFHSKAFCRGWMDRYRIEHPKP